MNGLNKMMRTEKTNSPIRLEAEEEDDPASHRQGGFGIVHVQATLARIGRQLM
jgi:hypothetical protein